MRREVAVVGLTLVPLLAVAPGGCKPAGKGSTNSDLVFTVPQEGSGLVLRPAGGIDVRAAWNATIAIGDLNGDGKPDLAVAYASAGRVGVFLGKGDGTFQAMPELAAGTFPWKVTMGDLDGDGRLDLVTANRGAASVSVFLGNGDGTFQPKVDFPAGAEAGWVELGDLNGDGNPDLVVGGPPTDVPVYGGSNEVRVLLGNGDGTFLPKVEYPTGANPTVAAVGDLNGDHNLDVVVAASGAGGVSVLLGKGDGTLAAKLDYATGLNPEGLALGDINGDGKLDIVATNRVSNTLSVLLGKGDGTFSSRADYHTGSSPRGVAIGDVDGDGKVDVVVANLLGDVSVFFGEGDGAFRSKLGSTIGVSYPYFVALANLDSVGSPEIVLTNLGYPGHFFPVALLGVGRGSPLTVLPIRVGGVSPGGVALSVLFQASSAGLARDVTWSLSPPVGTLSGATGTSVRYTPPATAAAPQVVQVIASGGGEQATSSISLSAQMARPLGSTSAPNGFLEYLPPGYDDGLPRPLLVFLHGSGGNGDGTIPETLVGNQDIPTMIAFGDWPAAYPFIVLSPKHSPTGSLCPRGAEVQAFIAWAMANYRVDSKQVYLTGFSCGAIAAWEYLATYLDSQVAAAVLIAGDPGGAWNLRYCDLGKVAIWALHGTDDVNVPPNPERSVMEQLIACPAPPRRDAVFTLIPGRDHFVSTDIYLGVLGYDVFTWLLAHPKP